MSNRRMSIGILVVERISFRLSGMNYDAVSS